MVGPQAKTYRFASFCLDVDACILSRGGQPIPLTPKEFETLLILVENSGRLVKKETLIARVWPNTFVGDGSLTRNISVLRKALGEEIIETHPKLGYRLNTVATLVPSQPLTLEEELVSSTHLEERSLERTATTRQKHAVSTNRLVILVAAAALCAVVSWMAFRQFGRRDSSPKLVAGPVTIAVLPFVNLTGNDKEEYVCDGLTESMISELSRLSPERLSVIARTSAMHYKSTTEAVPQIARELGVDYVLESSLRSSGDRLHVTSQLVRGTDARHLWTGEYERNLKDVLDVQQQVAIAIASEIKLNIPAATTARLHQEHPVNSDAYQDYLLGRFHWNKRNREGLLESVKFFERAIQQDPRFARAYAGISDAYLTLGGGYMPPKEAYDKARASALKALELDDTLAEAHVSLAFEKFIHERDWPGSEENYRLALRLDPNYATGHLWYAMYLSSFLRTEEALKESQQAIALDPLSLSANYNRAWILKCAERYDEAMQQLQRGLEIDPNSAVVHGIIAVVYVEKREYEQARKEFQKAQDLRGEYSGYGIETAHIYALEGFATKAETALRPLLADPGWQKAAPYTFALTYAALGKKDEAFRWLSRCVDDHSCGVSEINTDHGLDPLRSDPRFGEIRRYLKLPN